MAASINRGRFSISVFTMVISASITTGMSSGSMVSMVFSTCENRSTTVSKSVGRSSPTVANSAFRAVGRAAMIFSITGVILVSTSWNASTTLLQSISMSASALPKPTIRLSMAAFMEFKEPSMVCSASAAVAPATPMLSWMTWIASTTSA